MKRLALLFIYLFFYVEMMMCKLLVCLLGFSLDFTSGSFSFCFYNRGRAAICIANKALASDDLRKTKPNQTQPNPTKPNPPNNFVFRMPLNL